MRAYTSARARRTSYYWCPGIAGTAGDARKTFANIYFVRRNFSNSNKTQCRMVRAHTVKSAKMYFLSLSRTADRQIGGTAVHRYVIGRQSICTRVDMTTIKKKYAKRFENSNNFHCRIISALVCIHAIPLRHDKWQMWPKRQASGPWHIDFRLHFLVVRISMPFSHARCLWLFIDSQSGDCYGLKKTLSSSPARTFDWSRLVGDDYRLLWMLDSIYFVKFF